jgi:hypothetical protein
MGALGILGLRMPKLTSRISAASLGWISPPVSNRAGRESIDRLLTRIMKKSPQASQDEFRNSHSTEVHVPP